MDDFKTYTVCVNCNQVNRVKLAGHDPVCGKCKHALPIHDGVTELTPATLRALTAKSPVPVVVDFWAPWCGPCRAFAPTFKQAAAKLGGKVVCAKIDTEAHPSAGQSFQVRGIPTLIIFHHGQELDRQSGAFPLQDFLNWIQQSLSSPASVR